MAKGASAHSARELRSLRLRISTLIFLVVLAVVVVLTAVSVGLDSRLRREQLDTQLLDMTTRGVNQLDIEEVEVSFEALAEQGIADNVVISFRPEIFAEDIRASTLSALIPDFDQAELTEARLAQLDEDDLLYLLELEDEDEPRSLEEMRSRARDVISEEGFDEIYVDYALHLAEVEGIPAPYPPNQVFRSATSLITEADARHATELVAEEVERLGLEDRFEHPTFDVADGQFVARGAPIRSGFEVLGTVVAFVDPAPSRAEHAAFRRQAISLGALLALLATGATWWIAGRTIKPVAQALARQERFLADAAHELRTPIAAIRATAEVGVGAGSEMALERVVDLTEGASVLTDDLLTLARMDAERFTLQTEPVRLDLLVEAAINDDAAFRLRATQSVVEVDPLLASRAIGNLLNNARLHGNATAEKPADVVVAGDVVQIRDYGPGLDPALGEALFERFGSRVGSPGHGLGLPLARWIARAHGGDCVIDLTVDHGAAFTLRFD